MTEGQNYKMTDRTKIICLPIFDLGGIKMAAKSFYIIFPCVHLIILSFIMYKVHTKLSKVLIRSHSSKIKIFHLINRKKRIMYIMVILQDKLETGKIILLWL